MRLESVVGRRGGCARHQAVRSKPGKVAFVRRAVVDTVRHQAVRSKPGKVAFVFRAVVESAVKLKTVRMEQEAVPTFVFRAVAESAVKLQTVRKEQ